MIKHHHSKFSAWDRKSLSQEEDVIRITIDSADIYYRDMGSSTDRICMSMTLREVVSKILLEPEAFIEARWNTPFSFFDSEGDPPITINIETDGPFSRDHIEHLAQAIDAWSHDSFKGIIPRCRVWIRLPTEVVTRLCYLK